MRRVLLLAAALAPSLAAQQHEIGLTLGRIGGPERNGLQFDSGIALQANYGYRIHNGKSTALYAEFHFLANGQREIASANRQATRDVATIYGTPGLRLKIKGLGRLAPYLAAGAGYALYEQSLFRIDGSPNPAPRFTHRGAINFGGGVDVPLWRFVGARFEVRDFYTGSPSFNTPAPGGQHNVVIGGGLVLRFGEN